MGKRLVWWLAWCFVVVPVLLFRVAWREVEPWSEVVAPSSAAPAPASSPVPYGGPEPPGNPSAAPRPPAPRERPRYDGVFPAKLPEYEFIEPMANGWERVTPYRLSPMGRPPVYGKPFMRRSNQLTIRRLICGRCGGGGKENHGPSSPMSPCGACGGSGEIEQWIWDR